MIFSRRILVGAEPFDVAANTGGSSVQVSMVRNASDSADLLLCDLNPSMVEFDDPDVQSSVLRPGEQLQGVSLGSTDHLFLFRRSGSEDVPVDLILGWSA